MKSKQEALARAMADLATESILFEVILTPKPGLVDAKDPGSHRDMDIFTFVRSAVSLSHGFREFFLAGFTGEEDLPALFARIRPLGMEVEEKMFDATGKVNTHKGIIFSMGIILAALGRYARTREGEGLYTPEETEAVLQLVTQMTQGLVSKDFQSLAHRSPATHGERLYVEHGFTGIRGEAEAGYPVLREKALPALRSLAKETLTLEDKLLEVLLLLMAHAEDSNVVTRGGIHALHEVQAAAKKFLADGGVRHPGYKDTLNTMNDTFRQKNLSPGGAADLLSLAIFFGKLEGLIH